MKAQNESINSESVPSNHQIEERVIVPQKVESPVKPVEISYEVKKISPQKQQMYKEEEIYEENPLDMSMVV